MEMLLIISVVISIFAISFVTKRLGRKRKILLPLGLSSVLLISSGAGSLLLYDHGNGLNRVQEVALAKKDLDLKTDPVELEMEEGKAITSKQATESLPSVVKGSKRTDTKGLSLEMAKDSSSLGQYSWQNMDLIKLGYLSEDDYVGSTSLLGEIQDKLNTDGDPKNDVKFSTPIGFGYKETEEMSTSELIANAHEAGDFKLAFGPRAKTSANVAINSGSPSGKDSRDDSSTILSFPQKYNGKADNFLYNIYKKSDILKWAKEAGVEIPASLSQEIGESGNELSVSAISPLKEFFAGATVFADEIVSSTLVSVTTSFEPVPGSLEDKYGKLLIRNYKTETYEQISEETVVVSEEVYNQVTEPGYITTHMNPEYSTRVYGYFVKCINPVTGAYEGEIWVETGREQYLSGMSSSQTSTGDLVKTIKSIVTRNEKKRTTSTSVTLTTSDSWTSGSTTTQTSGTPSSIPPITENSETEPSETSETAPIEETTESSSSSTSSTSSSSSSSSTTDSSSSSSSSKAEEVTNSSTGNGGNPEDTPPPEVDVPEAGAPAAPIDVINTNDIEEVKDVSNTEDSAGDAQTQGSSAMQEVLASTTASVSLVIAGTITTAGAVVYAFKP